MTAARLETVELTEQFPDVHYHRLLIIIVMAGLILFYRWNQTQIKTTTAEAEMSQTFCGLK